MVLECVSAAWLLRCSPEGTQAPEQRREEIRAEFHEDHWTAVGRLAQVGWEAGSRGPSETRGSSSGIGRRQCGSERG